MGRVTKVLAVVAATFGVAVFSCGPGNKEINCTNGVDDDNNGAADCLDPACTSNQACLNYDGGGFSNFCENQAQCLDGGFNIDRPLRACLGQRCTRQGSSIGVKVNVTTLAFGGTAGTFRAMATRIVSKVALDNSSVSCADIRTAAPGRAAADADQLERTRRFNYLAYDNIRINDIPKGQAVPNPLLYTSTGDNFLFYVELWSDYPDSTTRLPTGQRLGYACSESGAPVAALTTADDCNTDAGSCRLIQVAITKE